MACSWAMALMHLPDATSSNDASTLTQSWLVKSLLLSNIATASSRLNLSACAGRLNDHSAVLTRLARTRLTWRATEIYSQNGYDTMAIGHAPCSVSQYTVIRTNNSPADPALLI